MGNIPSSHDLVSPFYHNSGRDQSWCLVRLGMRHAPKWVLGPRIARRQMCLFREIAYLNAHRQVEGVGRSWLPMSGLFLRLLLRAFNPINPEPIGVAVKKILDSNC